jgi:hypothetical protein
MIRREVEPGWFHLITQEDHARLSGELARRVGNEFFDGVSEAVVRAVAVHDGGWPLHDEAPTLNEAGKPRDVFESNRQIALPVWTASSDRAEAMGAYEGLLVSLHGLALSVYATTQAAMKHEKLDTSHLQDKFSVNQFQHREVERQEALRKRLGMRVDLPLKYGLAAEGVDEREDRLRADFRLLQAMDMLSLSICCTQPPAPTTQEVHPRVGDKAIKLGLQRVTGDLLQVDPWPFTEDEIELEVGARKVEARAYGSEREFFEVYRAAPAEMLQLTIARG